MENIYVKVFGQLADIFPGKLQKETNTIRFVARKNIVQSNTRT